MVLFCPRQSKSTCLGRSSEDTYPLAIMISSCTLVQTHRAEALLALLPVIRHLWVLGGAGPDRKGKPFSAGWLDAFLVADINHIKCCYSFFKRVQYLLNAPKNGAVFVSVQLK